MDKKNESKGEILYVHASVVVCYIKEGSKEKSTEYVELSVLELRDHLSVCIDFDGEIKITQDALHTNEYCAYIGAGTSIVLDPKIGRKITVQHGAHVGENCRIEANAIIGYVAQVGNGAIVSKGARLCPHSTLDAGAKLGVGESVPTSTALTKSGEFVPLRTHKI